MNYYIYIIHSKQFSENVYKVGYTSNLNDRIKNSCYTTCFYEPCKYIHVYQFTLNQDQFDTYTPIQVEQSLHSVLRKHPIVKWLKTQNNSCTEMYNVDIKTLIDVITNVLKTMDYITFKAINIEKTLQRDEIHSLLADGEYIGYKKHEKHENYHCCCCNRAIQQVYFVNFLSKSYYFGKKCFGKIYKKNVKISSREIIYDIIKRTGLPDEITKEKVFTEWFDKCKFRSKMDEKIKSCDIKTEIFLMLRHMSKNYEIACKCNYKYNLYRLSVLFNKSYTVSTNVIMQWDLNDYQYKTFYKILEELEIFNITSNLIILKTQQSQIIFIDEFFSNYKRLDIYVDDTKEKIINPYTFTQPSRQITYSKYVKCKQAVYDIFSYNRSILSGCAGAGKTTCVFGFINNDENIYIPARVADYFSDTERNVLVLAFTGKARSVIEETYHKCKKSYGDICESEKKNFKYLENMKCTFHTIDSFLVSRSKKSFDYIIIDEISMLTLSHLYIILERCPDSNYLLLGDENQLEPVDGPSIMKELISKCCTNTKNDIKYIFARMEECHRAGNGHIKELYSAMSQNINNCTIDNIRKYCKRKNVPKNIINFIYYDDLHKFVNVNDHHIHDKILTYKNTTKDELCLKIHDSLHNPAEEIIKTHMCIKNLYIDKDQQQNLKKLLGCLMRGDGYDMYNDTSQKKIKIVDDTDDDTVGEDHNNVILNNKEEQYNKLKKEYRKIKTNDNLSLVIKDIIKKMDNTDNIDEEKCLLFYNGQDLIFDNSASGENILYFCKLMLKYIHSSFEYTQSNIITIHKSQGSSYGSVIIDARESMSCELLYTATTRSKNTIIYVISKSDVKTIDELKTMPPNDSLKYKLIRLGNKLNCYTVNNESKKYSLNTIIFKINKMLKKGCFLSFTKKQSLKLTPAEEEIYLKYGVNYK